MEPLSFQLDYTTFTIPPLGYVFDEQGSCIIGVSYVSDSANLYILGDTFIRNFVVTFDYGEQSMKLTRNVNAPEGVSISWQLSPLQIFAIVFGCVVVVGLVIWLVLCLLRRRKAKKMVSYQGQGYMIGDNGTALAQHQESLRH